MRRNTGYTNLVISSCPCHIPVIQHMHPNDIPISQGSTWCRRLAAKGYAELGPLLLSPATKSLQSTKDNSRIIWRHCGGSVVPLLFWVLLEVEVDDVHVSQSDLVMTGDTTGFTLPRCLADTFYQEYIALFIVEYSHVYWLPEKPCLIQWFIFSISDVQSNINIIGPPGPIQHNKNIIFPPSDFEGSGAL